jgi:hypothetical protein
MERIGTRFFLCGYRGENEKRYTLQMDTQRGIRVPARASGKGGSALVHLSAYERNRHKGLTKRSGWRRGKTGDVGNPRCSLSCSQWETMP